MLKMGDLDGHPELYARLLVRGDVLRLVPELAWSVDERTLHARNPLPRDPYRR